MSRLVTFKILRYALIPYEQMAHWERPLPDPKGRAIEVALPLGETPPRRFEYRKRDHALVGFSPISDDDRFLLGRLAKKRKTAIGELREHDVIEITTDDWLPVWLFVDTDRQYIAVEMHGRFGRLGHVVQILQQVLTESVEEAYRHEVIVSPVTDARAFWEIVERASHVYRARLHFVSPNFLDTPGEFRELLKQWKRLFNQTEAGIELRNDDGKLLLPDALLKEPVEYIAAGEGDWKLSVEEAGQRHSISSMDSSESLHLPIPRASRYEDEIAQTGGLGQTLVEAVRELLRRRHD